MDDIAYNFLIGGNGFAYIGRGWDVEGKHTKGFDKKSICIAMIGTFNDEVPPKIQLDTLQNLIDVGIKLKKVASNYDLNGQLQFNTTIESPGRKLYDIIKTWNHWTTNIT